MIFPIEKGIPRRREEDEEGVFRTGGDVATKERSGHEQPVAFIRCRDISACLSSARMGSTHTQHVAIAEPTT